MSEDEQLLLERAAALRGFTLASEFTIDAFRALAAREGIDFATSVLYHRVRHMPPHASFIEALETQSDEPDARLDARVVIVPGAFYQRFPDSGADGRILREEAARLGCSTALVPLPNFASLEVCAQILMDWLAAQPEEPIVLVSLSKGGADIKAALAKPGAADVFKNVIAWVNLCGLLDGTPLANWALDHWLRRLWFRTLFWFQGAPFAPIRDLLRQPGGPLDFGLTLPEHLLLISVVGFPLQRHLTNRLSRRCYRIVEALGPNDGAGIVLADVCRLPGLVYPVWGADHYLRPAHMDTRLLARRILCFLAERGARHSCLAGQTGMSGPTSIS